METTDKTFRFVPEPRGYWLGDERLPSVTEVLRGTGFIEATHFNDYSRTLGTYVHDACKFSDDDSLVLDDHIKPYEGYVKAYEKFKVECDFWPEQVERPLYNDIHRFAGTPDRIGLFQGRRAVIDLKTGAFQEWHRYQTAGYGLLIPPGPLSRFGLYLKDDGSYRLERHSDAEDYDVFLSALTVFRALGGTKCTP